MSSWPTELRLAKDRRSLHVTFDDGARFALPAELLRVESPSAEVQGHHPSQKTIVAGKAAVEILKVEPVGHYAVKLTFDDMHDTGLYAWDYLRELGEHGIEKMAAYEAALAEKGLSRERR
ncbi:gamma-butyrobetaine hydroxylase-like domain-containing protein [Bosea sp. (in: a-proteobacteria)]|uniref:gamma-butyrobetaine hydroxylase-like domain-containing protein n=1 Tax=Bosea sp. (in: a-proteobacteria) TaxID=1871050 RepID=UPI003B3A0844